MRARYSLRGLDRTARAGAKKLLDALETRIEALLPGTHRSGSFAVWVQPAPTGFAARAVVRAPLGTVYVETEDSNVHDLIEALEEVLLHEMRQRRAEWSRWGRGRGAGARAQLASAEPALHALRAEGRRQDFDELLRALSGPVRRYAERELELARAANPALSSVEVDDLLHEVLVDAWERWDEARGSLDLWMLGQVHERIDAADTEAAILLPESSVSTVDDWVHDNSPFWPEPEELRLDDLIPGSWPDPFDLVSALEGVSPVERRALLLKEVEGLDEETTAAVLGRSVDTVRELVSRASDKLDSLSGRATRLGDEPRERRRT